MGGRLLWRHGVVAGSGRGADDRRGAGREGDQPRFAAASAGPGLAAPSTYTYPVDGGCPGPNRFDALTKVGDADAQNAAFYPNAQVAGIARSRELDTIADKDRNKAMAYGYSIQFVRDPAYGVTNAN